MKNTLRQSTLSLVLAASLIGSAAWSSDSRACSPDPYLADICIYASPSYSGGFNEYSLADGSTISVSSNAALFALLGATYGGDGRTNFALPDMRGRVVVGAGIYTDPKYGQIQYLAGQKGGDVAVTLTAANLPAHNHTLGVAATATVGGQFAATTSLANTAANLAGIPFTSSSSNLSMKAANSGAATANPTASSSLSTLSILGGKIYGSAAPDTVLAANSVVGTVSGTLAGTAPITGTATTTITGAPTVTLGGATDVTGTGAPVSVMQPYLAMYYFIATTGIFPSHH